jgi:thiamine-monophosphate kinase
VRALSTTVSDRTEGELIATIQAQLRPAPSWIAVGIGDDAAVVEPERNRLEVLTVDAQVDGVHFDRHFVPADAIGHRALAVNLSDIAAMGAEPRLALLSLALPADWPLEDFERFAEGFGRLAAAHGVHVVGGNLTRTPGPLVIDVTVIGSVKRRAVLARRGARAADAVFVSGAIGSAAAGLSQLRQFGPDAPINACIERYLRPEPRVRLGTLLGRNRAASACMDLSDGLAEGAHQLAAASGVGIAIDAGVVPIEPDARAWSERCGRDPVVDAVTGGDDYELMFTCRPRLGGRFRTVARQCGLTLTNVGVCTADGLVSLERDGRSEPMPRGYGHFR